MLDNGNERMFTDFLHVPRLTGGVVDPVTMGMD